MTGLGLSRPQAHPERRLPPVAEVAISSLVLVVVGGIAMASYVPRRPPLGLPVTLLAASAALLLGAVAMLVRLPAFPWQPFFRIARWSLLAYIIAAGMIELAFVHNHARGAPLAVVTALLVVFALDVPLTIAYTVVRFTVLPSRPPIDATV